MRRPTTREATCTGHLSPQEFEEAIAESLGRLSREERRELRRRLRQQRGGQIDVVDDDDPRLMAWGLSQTRQQGSDDPLGGPVSKAVLAGVAAFAMKKMMSGR